MARDYVLQPFRPEVELGIDYRAELNEQQYAAVTAAPGPALVIAGAGSGKTRTLIYRVAFLLEQGIPPDRILLVTFTNKAAREMMRRVAALLGGDQPDLWGGTFHSIGNRVLRRFADRLGYGRDFTILDREDAVDLVKSCLEKAEVPGSAVFPKADVLAELFSLAVNTRRSIRELLEADYREWSTLWAEIEEMGRRYAARKKETNVVDFDDLLAHWLQLLEQQSDVLDQYQRRFQFLLVDEYQDTNRLQAEIVDLLAARHHNVMAVGDDSQSIYSWRGAEFRNIFEFPKRYPEATVYRIELNYRSTPEILNVANAAIEPNERQFRKALEPVRRPGSLPALVVCADAQVQAAFIAQRAVQLREEGVNLGRMAVLYRSHFHALELQLELTRRQIPFSIVSGIRFFEQAHIKDVVAYLKWICNPRDELSFKRLTGLLPGIGARSAENLWAAFQVDQGRGGDTAARGPLAPALERLRHRVPKRAMGAWEQLTETVRQLEDPSLRGQPSKLIGLVLEAGYESYLKSAYTQHARRLEDLEQLAVFAASYRGLEDFLAELSLLSGLESEPQSAPAPEDEERLRLSTVHQAKGLEFDVVFLMMLCDGMFPTARSSKRPETEEEERRLFYVGITRARDELYLSFPLVRRMGGGAGVSQKPSRFLRAIPETLLDSWNLRSFYG